jgi:hypothetical protein
VLFSNSRGDQRQRHRAGGEDTEHHPEALAELKARRDTLARPGARFLDKNAADEWLPLPRANLLAN